MAYLKINVTFSGIDLRFCMGISSSSSSATIQLLACFGTQSARARCDRLVLFVKHSVKSSTTSSASTMTRLRAQLGLVCKIRLSPGSTRLRSVRLRKGPGHGLEKALTTKFLHTCRRLQAITREGNMHQPCKQGFACAHVRAYTCTELLLPTTIRI